MGGRKRPVVLNIFAISLVGTHLRGEPIPLMSERPSPEDGETARVLGLQRGAEKEWIRRVMLNRGVKRIRHLRNYTPASSWKWNLLQFQ